MAIIPGIPPRWKASCLGRRGVCATISTAIWPVGCRSAARPQHAKLSPGYFSRRFRQSFGLTFSRFVARRRIEHAQAMMTKTTSSLCQIALACGFTDQAHFTRTFGGVTGSTPSQWRRMALLGGQVQAMGSC
ncbi:helix-turn-helix domain-containing protein [Caulobacter segnis]